MLELGDVIDTLLSLKSCGVGAVKTGAHKPTTHPEWQEVAIKEAERTSLMQIQQMKDARPGRKICETVSDAARVVERWNEHKLPRTFLMEFTHDLQLEHFLSEPPRSNLRSSLARRCSVLSSVRSDCTSWTVLSLARPGAVQGIRSTMTCPTLLHPTRSRSSRRTSLAFQGQRVKGNDDVARTLAVTDRVPNLYLVFKRFPRSVVEWSGAGSCRLIDKPRLARQG